jgi:hypothetical protein
LPQLFQRSRLKYEKVNGRTTDDGQTMDIKWWQYLTSFGSGELKRTDNTMANRRTDNTMANRRRTNGQTTIHRKLNIEQHEPH